MLILRNPSAHSDSRETAAFFGAECRCGWTTKLAENALDMGVQQLAHTKRTGHSQFWEYEITRHRSRTRIPGQPPERPSG